MFNIYSRSDLKNKYLINFFTCINFFKLFPKIKRIIIIIIIINIYLLLL